MSADGRVQVSPDVAFVSIGVQKQNIDAGRAQEEANRVAAAALANIRALGIPARDIQTSGVSLDPQYDDHGTLTGFLATDSFSITVEKLRQAGAVIDAGVRAGANRGVGVSFGLANDGEARTAALRAAVALAQQKAAAVAAQLGLSLQGARVEVVENASQTPIPYAADGRSMAAPSTAGAATPVQGGQLSILDNVTVTYTLP